MQSHQTASSPSCWTATLLIDRLHPALGPSEGFLSPPAPLPIPSVLTATQYPAHRWILCPGSKQMEGSKQMLEAKLQDAGLQLMECERQLLEALNSAAAATSSGTPISKPRSSVPPLDTPTSSAASKPRHHFFNSILEDEVGGVVKCL